MWARGKGGKMLKPLSSLIFHAELAILHQNWKSYISVNIGQNEVQKLPIFTKPTRGYLRKRCFICWSKSHLSQSTGFLSQGSHSPTFGPIRHFVLLASFSRLYLVPSPRPLSPWPPPLIPFTLALWKNKNTCQAWGDKRFTKLKTDMKKRSRRVIIAVNFEFQSLIAQFSLTLLSPLTDSSKTSRACRYHTVR